MPHAAFVIPGDIDMPTGGYAYDRRVLALLPGCGVPIRHVALPGHFPSPTPADLLAAARVLADTPTEAVLLIDGLAYGAMPADFVSAIGRRIVALVHHPLCLEAGLTPTRQATLRASEIAALAFARHVVVTSEATARILSAEFAVARDLITVAVPGTDAQPRATGTATADPGEPLRLLAVGSIIPRKGYDVLIDALAPLRFIPWQLDIAGGLDMNPATVIALRRQIDDRGLSARVSLLGAVDEQRLARLYDRCDLFVMASHYEGFGMVLTEALARGLPVVCTSAGVAVDMVPDDAVVKCEPGDARALMWTLGRAMETGGIRQRTADAAWAAAQTLPRWPDTARIIAGVIEKVGRT